MDQNLMNLDEAMKESLEKIFQLLDEKKYFLAKDELLKYNDADIAEMFEELLDKPELIELFTACCQRTFRLRFFRTCRRTTSSRLWTALRIRS